MNKKMKINELSFAPINENLPKLSTSKKINWHRVKRRSMLAGLALSVAMTANQSVHSLIGGYSGYWRARNFLPTWNISASNNSYRLHIDYKLDTYEAYIEGNPTNIGIRNKRITGVRLGFFGFPTWINTTLFDCSVKL